GAVLARGMGRQLALGYRVARAAVDPVRVDADRLGPSRAGVHRRADPAGDGPHAAVWDRPAEGVAMSPEPTVGFARRRHPRESGDPALAPRGPDCAPRSRVTTGFPLSRE